MKVDILFGSQSDAPIYNELLEILQEQSFSCRLQVLSAHRNPNELRSFLADSTADLFFAGAGLAAHLPGVVASLVEKPVFGVPVMSQFGGLDAFLSIVQMPSGVPVCAVEKDSLRFLKRFLNKSQNAKAKVFANQSLQATSDFQKQLAKLEGLAWEYCEIESQADIVCLDLLQQESADIWERTIGKSLFVPFLNAKAVQDPASSLLFLDWFERGGFWFGMNNLKNALCFQQKLGGVL